MMPLLLLLLLLSPLLLLLLLLLLYLGLITIQNDDSRWRYFPNIEIAGHEDFAGRT